MFDYRKMSYEMGGNFAWIGCAVEVVGDLTLNVRSEEHRGGELGFIVHPRHQGKGYATEAARALLRWAFEEVGFHRVYGRTEPRNEASGLARPQREPSAAGWVRKGLGPSSALEAPLP